MADDEKRDPRRTVYLEDAYWDLAFQASLAASAKRGDRVSKSEIVRRGIIREAKALGVDVPNGLEGK